MDLDFGIEGLDLKSLCFGSSGLGYLENGFGLPHSSNFSLGAYPTLDYKF